jgi:alanine dehydrogenase
MRVLVPVTSPPDVLEASRSVPALRWRRGYGVLLRERNHMAMVVGVPQEMKADESRVGMTPAGVEMVRLADHNHRVLVEAGAGAASGFDDAQYKQAGAIVVASAEEVWYEADLVVKVKEPQLAERAFLRPGQVVFAFFHLAADRELTLALMDSGVTAVAFETVRDRQNRLPLLAPMSEIAGRMSVQAAARHLECPQGGRGLLLAGVPGVEPAEVVVLGGGMVGANAAKVAAGFGASVRVLDVDIDRLRYLDEVMPKNVTTVFSTTRAIRDAIKSADVVIGAVLKAGARAPQLVRRADLGPMRKGAVVVDVAIDQGGCFETSRRTTHAAPTYVVDEIIHYCVANIPGAVARTSTPALCNATLPYVLKLAHGLDAALSTDPGLAEGVNVYRGEVTHRGVAEAFDLVPSPATRDAMSATRRSRAAFVSDGAVAGSPVLQTTPSLATGTATGGLAR